MMYSSILAAAGQAPGLDGLDMSSALRLGGASPRQEMVYNLDERNFHRGPGSTQPSWQAGLRLELQTKIREDFTITEKAPTRSFSWLKRHTSTFTFKTLCQAAVNPQ